MTTATEISTAIINGNFSNDDFNTIIGAINDARKISRQQKSLAAKHSLRPGDTVSLSGLKSTPNGTRGVLKEIKQTRGIVNLPNSRGQIVGYSIPLSCMTKVS